jgi:membrane protease YdiL (CAAX protease family)
LKDAARLLAYLVATVLFGALMAPPLYWAEQWLASEKIFPSLANFDFEAFFHRALMLGAVLFLWPLLRSLGVRNQRDLGLVRNSHWIRDMVIGFFLSAGPVICLASVLLLQDIYNVRSVIKWNAIGSVALTAMVVPLIEESLFRGFFLGVMLRRNRPLNAMLLTSAVYAIIHFLKAPDDTTTEVSWFSGFVSLSHSFDQFRSPMLVLGGFTTLFLIGLILADSRLRTKSLWLPIGLHAGWIFASGTFNKIAQREVVILPWLGKNLLVGFIPLAVCLVSWLCLWSWQNYARKT